MDPFSVATGGAGLASLGITICNGILTYCINFRSRGDDLATLRQRAKELKDLLRQLEALKQRGSGVEDKIESSLRDCCNACSACLQEIDVVDKKYFRQSQPSTLKDHGTAISRKFQYPFQKGKLDGLRHQLHELQVVLSNQLILLNSDLTIDLCRLTTTESEAIRTEITKHSDLLLSVVSSTSSGVQKTFDESLNKVGQTLERRLENLEELVITSFERLHSEDRQGLDNYKCKKPAISEAKQNPVDRGSILIRSDSMLDLNCYCPWTMSGSHQSTCIYSFRLQKKRKVLTGRALLLNLMFTLKINARYSPDGFPWNFQIYPDLSITTFMADSPAWRVLDDGDNVREFRGIPLEELSGRCQRALTALRQLYSSGKCRPTDVDNFGRNLFLRATFQLIGRPGEDCDRVPIILQFLKGLVQMGVPINQVTMYDCTPLLSSTSMFWYSPRPYGALMVFVKGLIELGAEFMVLNEVPLSGLGGLPLLSHELREEIGLTIPLEYGELSRAILKQSEGEMQLLLSRCRLSILETGPSGETPLHLAAYWARGLEILLEHLRCEELQNVLDAEDCQGFTALSYALSLRQLDCVVLLIHSGAYIDVEDTCSIEMCNFYRHTRPQADDIIRFLCEVLAGQRKQLLSDAKKWLSIGTTSHESQRSSFRMLQEEAFEVVRHLRDNWPAKMWPAPRPGSIYHADVMSVNLARALYDVGFDRTNVFFHGFSPLMTINLAHLGYNRCLPGLLDLMDWFVDHGTNLDAAMPCNAGYHDPSSELEIGEFCLMQRCAFWLGWFWISQNQATTLLWAKRIAKLLQITKLPPRDPCVCLCTGRGCSPASIFIRGLLSINILRPHRDAHASRLLSLDDVVFQLYDNIQCKKVAAQFFLDVLRTITFEILDMRHVCCRYEEDLRCGDVGQAILDGEFECFHLMDPNEIVEIKEEDRYRAERLEELIVEFEDAYKPSEQLFKSFYSGYYLQRMKSVLEEQEVLTLEDSLRIRETGVILDMNSNSDSD